MTTKTNDTSLNFYSLCPIPNPNSSNPNKIPIPNFQFPILEV